MANTAWRDVPAALSPCAITAEPGALSDCASLGQRPAARKFVAGSRPSTRNDDGTDVNHTGGSTIAVSAAGYAPTTGDTPGSRTQLMIPERPLPLRLAVTRPATSAAETRNAPAFVPPPT